MLRRRRASAFVTIASIAFLFEDRCRPDQLIGSAPDATGAAGCLGHRAPAASALRCIHSPNRIERIRVSRLKPWIRAPTPVAADIEENES